MNNTDLTQLLTAGEICEALRISRRTLDRMAQAGQFIEPVMVGQSRRYHPADLARWIEEAKI